MKNLILICTLLIFSKGLSASPQMPDYLMYKNDTIPVYNLIIEEYLNKNTNDDGSLFGFKFRNTNDGIPLNCWRGYQAIYAISNDSLFLKHIISCGEKELRPIDVEASNKKMSELFSGRFINRKVFIGWFSGNLSIQNGKLLKWDGIFSRTFEKEIVFKFKNGRFEGRTEVLNYINNPKHLNRKYNDVVSDILFSKIKKIRWKNSQKFDCSHSYIITINKEGRISKVALNNVMDADTKEEADYCSKTLYDVLKNIRFDIIKKEGFAIEEMVNLELWVNDDGTIENWTN